MRRIYLNKKNRVWFLKKKERSSGDALLADRSARALLELSGSSEISEPFKDIQTLGLQICLEKHEHQARHTKSYEEPAGHVTLRAYGYDHSRRAALTRAPAPAPGCCAQGLFGSTCSA
jgi:hypothetical protein